MYKNYAQHCINVMRVEVLKINDLTIIELQHKTESKMPLNPALRLYETVMHEAKKTT